MSSSPDQEAQSDFSARLVDNFFDRWYLYLLPIVVFATIGVFSAREIQPEFVADATLSASANPLVPSTEIRTTEIDEFFETPAGGTARLINEQLRTDAFVDGVRERAGFEEGEVGRGTIREQVGADAQGQNFVSVAASWDDPETARLLVESTIAAYFDYLAEIVLNDSRDATEFLGEQLAEAEGKVAAAETELATYVAALPPLEPGATRTTEQELELQRRSSTLDRAIAAVEELEADIAAAEVSVEQSLSEAGRLLRVVDAPTAPSSPEPNRMEKVLTVAMFTVIGLLLSLAALVAATVFDKTVRSSSQLAGLVHADVAVAVPSVKALRRRRRRARRAHRAPAPKAREAA